ncbi:MAG: SDR family oxidoreductase UcpA [Bacilli bacterium]|nr:SDR family oxidoreductase UcpA [Bacilli bacterium]
MKKLEDKVAIITGGAMGNGLGVAKVFLSYGADIAIFDYADSLKNTIDELREDYPKAKIKGFKVDIRDKERVIECVEAVNEEFQHIDILVNNAGVARLESFETMSDETRDLHFDINIKGTWNVTQAVIPYMKNNNQSSIVNLSSVTGPRVADPGEVAYATTKAAIMGFSKALAVELVDYNIRSNAILPGYIITPMVEGIGTDSNPDDPQSVIDGIAVAIPMKRLGKIEELGELAAFLASAESSYITGHEFVIDGGSTLPETTSVGV